MLVRCRSVGALAVCCRYLPVLRGTKVYLRKSSEGLRRGDLHMHHNPGSNETAEDPHVLCPSSCFHHAITK
jgi:hypothetical protein